MYLDNVVCTVVPIRGRWHECASASTVPVIHTPKPYWRRWRREYVTENDRTRKAESSHPWNFPYLLSLTESEMCNMSPLATGPVRDNEPLLLLFNGPN